MMRFQDISAAFALSCALIACGGATSKKKAVPTKFGDTELTTYGPVLTSQPAAPASESAPLVPAAAPTQPTAVPETGSPVTPSVEAPAPTEIVTADPLDGRWDDVLPEGLSPFDITAQFRISIIVDRAHNTIKTFVTSLLVPAGVQAETVETTWQVEISATTITFITGDAPGLLSAETPDGLDPSKLNMNYVLNGDRLEGTFYNSNNTKRTFARARP